MSMLGFNSSSSSHSNSGMMSQSNTPFFHDFKKQASFYFKEKIKTARLALTDVTPAQLMTEEATNGNPWAPDAKTMGLISRAAFEVDDYWRIVEILHTRLASFDKKNWRPSYNALIVLEHLMTHGPGSVANEFQDEKSSIRKMQCFHHVDEKGFNWGLAVRKKSERILELLEKVPLLKEERDRARKVTRGIQGFGSFSKRVSSSNEGILQESRTTSHEIYGRSHSQYNEHCNNDNNNDDDDDNNMLPSSTVDSHTHTSGKANSSSKAVERPPLANTTMVVVHDENHQQESSRIRRAAAKENMAPKEELHGWSSSPAAGEMNSLLCGGGSNGIGEEEEQHPFSATEKHSKISLLGGAEEDW